MVKGMVLGGEDASLIGSWQVLIGWNQLKIRFLRPDRFFQVFLLYKFEWFGGLGYFNLYMQGWVYKVCQIIMSNNYVI